VARHSDLETASIPTELDFGRYRHAQEVTDSMSIETVDTRASAAVAVALVRHRAPETRHRDQCARLPAMRRHRHGAARSGTGQSSDEIGPVTPRGPGCSVKTIDLGDRHTRAKVVTVDRLAEGWA
jgi:hypothetical protein